MGKRRNKALKRQWQSAELNNLTFTFYYEYLEQLACSVFKWVNLPKEIDQRFLELVLFNYGLSVFFFDEDYDKFFALQGTPAGMINMYQNPTAYVAYGANGFRKRLSHKQCVPIWNNYLRRPDITAMRIYARRLADIDRTIEVNLKAQKMPVLVSCPESQKLTVTNLIKQWQGNEPIIVSDGGMLDMIQFAYIKPDVPLIVNDLLNAKQTIWSEIMSYLGIDNTNIKKAERVQSAEVEANDDQIMTSQLIRLNNRRAAIQEINDRYDLDIQCVLNTDAASANYAALAKLPALLLTEGDDDDPNLV